MISLGHLFEELDVTDRTDGDDFMATDLSKGSSAHMDKLNKEGASVYHGSSAKMSAVMFNKKEKGNNPEGRVQGKSKGTRPSTEGVNHSKQRC